MKTSSGVRGVIRNWDQNGFRWGLNSVRAPYGGPTIAYQKEKPLLKLSTKTNVPMSFKEEPMTARLDFSNFTGGIFQASSGGSRGISSFNGYRGKGTYRTEPSTRGENEFVNNAFEFFDISKAGVIQFHDVAQIFETADNKMNIKDAVASIFLRTRGTLDFEDSHEPITLTNELMNEMDLLKAVRDKKVRLHDDHFINRQEFTRWAMRLVEIHLNETKHAHIKHANLAHHHIAEHDRSTEHQKVYATDGSYSF